MPSFAAPGQSISEPQISFAWGGGDWLFPPNNLSEADHAAPEARHQKRGILSDAPFLVHRGNPNPNPFLYQTRAQRQRVAAEKEKQGHRSMWRCLCRHMTSWPCFDVVHRGNPNPNPEIPKRESLVRLPFRKGRRSQRIRSFRRPGGSGVQLASSDVVPVVGLEPTRCRHQRILSPSRLPFHHTGMCIEYIPNRDDFQEQNHLQLGTIHISPHDTLQRASFRLPILSAA